MVRPLWLSEEPHASLTEPVWSAAAEPPCVLHHAAGVGCCVGAVEHWSWHLWLLPHQCHGGEDPHTGKCPLYPPVCDCRPVCRPHPAHDLHTLEKTLKTNTPRPDTHYMSFCCWTFHVTQSSLHRDAVWSDNADYVIAHTWRSSMFSNIRTSQMRSGALMGRQNRATKLHPILLSVCPCGLDVKLAWIILTQNHNSFSRQLCTLTFFLPSLKDITVEKNPYKMMPFI